MIRVGMVGTFDVANFGDQLFPLVARAELRRRLDDLELNPYSYHARSAASWPFHVRPLEQLANEIDTLDLLIVGGGDIIRFDALVALGYRPDSPTIHHPTGFWLAPILLARVAGVPVAWNAPGVPAPVPAWARALVRAAVTASDYVAVRDTGSRELLAAVAPDADIAVVPDSCFGVRATMVAGGARLASVTDGDRRYVVVQSCRDALAVLPFIRERFRTPGTFVVTPIGPATGDSVGAPRGLTSGMIFRHVLTPHDLLALVADSSGVVGTSLHLTITALALGRPALRPMSAALRKYGQLDGLQGVQVIDPNGAPSAGLSEWPEPDPLQIAAINTRLSAHWDRIAALASTGRVRGRLPAGGQELMNVWQELPGALERHTPLERMRAAFHATRARIAASRYNPRRG